MPINKRTTFIITKKPGPLGIMVETSSIPIVSYGTGWRAARIVNYSRSKIDVFIAVRGQIGQELSMKMTINNITKEIKGKLKKNGLNKISKSYQSSTFRLPL